MAQSFPSLNHIPSAFPLPTIAEDTLHYTVHIPANLRATSTTTTTNNTADAAAPPPPSSSPVDTADAAALATLISTHVHSLLPQPWLWNKDGWELKVVDGSKLEGTMRVGDAVDDEWLVVWLLRQVSILWPGLVISIRDSDGEFLLIEAAHELPDWVSPENADNRLWLAGGHLHLLPLTVRSSSARPHQVADDDYDGSGRTRGDDNAWVSEPDALKAVETGQYRASAGMEGAVWERISCYPAALSTHQHHAKAYLPTKVARALHESPELIQRAVEGFYVRDPAQLRAAARMTHFPPSPAVLSSVLLTRAAYAQLQGQVFHPPRVFGPEWHVRDEAGNEGEMKWRDLGVKIATGFEIMYREGGRKGRVADAQTTAEQLAADPEYTKYISDLERAGFFGGERQGSAEWKNREQEAAKGWIAARSSDTAQQRPSFAYLVDHAVEQSATVPDSDLAVSPNAPEDSDKWLEVDPDELDAMLMRSAGTAKAKDAAESAPGAPAAPVELGDEHGKALQDLASKVEEFIAGQGDMQGARFADELSDEDMNSDSDDDDDDQPTEAQRQERMANLVPSLPAEEWGRKTQIEHTEAQQDIEMDASQSKSKATARGTVAGTAFGDSLLPPKMRPPVFAKEEYDGHVSNSDSDEDDEADLPVKGSLGRRIAQMKWGEGASDAHPREAHIEEIDDEDEDEGDEEDKADAARAKELKFDADEIDELMRQRVWGGDDKGDAAKADKERQQETAGMGEDEDGEGDRDGDVDMADEEEDFLKFSREALGISDDMWDKIIASRKERGAYVPEPKKKSDTGEAAAAAASSKPKVQFAEPATAAAAGPVPGQPNMALNSFESMMAAMDAELARAKGSNAAEAPPSAPPKVTFKPRDKSATGTATGSTSASAPTQSKSKKSNKSKAKSKGKGKDKDKGHLSSLASLPTEADLDAMDDDELAAMDAELRQALEGHGVDFDLDDDVPEAGELDEDQQREYAMMRDLLESFKSQGGESGVVGNLFGRLAQQGGGGGVGSGAGQK